MSDYNETGDIPGSEQWRFETDGRVVSSPTVGDGTVYVGSHDNNLYALDTTDGTEQWRFKIRDGFTSSPAVADGTVYAGSRNGLYALDADGWSGSKLIDSPEQWRFKSGGNSSPVVADGTVYIGNLYAVDATDGTEQWHFEVFSIYSSPTVADGTVYVGSHDNHLYAVDTTDGTEQWCFETGDSIYSSPAVARGIIYVGSDDNNLYAIDAADGTEQWRFKTGDEVKSPPTVADGTVYVGSFDSNLYAVDTTDGTEQWRFETGGKIESSPTVAGGMIYVGSDDNNLYAVATEDEQPPRARIGEGEQESLTPNPSTPPSQSDDSRRATSRRLPVGEMTEEIPPTQSESVVSPPRRPDLTREDMTIVKKIGAGGQAVVHKAQLSESNQPPAIVALREPVGSTTLTTQTVEAFLSQTDTWATVDARERNKQRWVNSEHVTGVIATGDELPWVAMEYIDGGNLEELLEEHPDGLPVREALWIGEGVCQGLEIAHNLGRVHLDVKPENILLKQTEGKKWSWPKLADWGLARTLAQQTGTMDGLSVEYAAPEQFDSTEFGDPDQLTDIYQTGALVYALLTGSPPATGSTHTIIQQVLSEESFTPPSEQRSELPGIIDAVVGVALKRDKTTRYNSIHSFKNSLNALRTGGRLPPKVSKAGDENTAATTTETSAQKNGDDTAE